MYSLNWLIRATRAHRGHGRDHLTLAETLGTNPVSPNGKNLLASTQPTSRLKNRFGCKRKRRCLRSPIRNPLQVTHRLVVTCAVQTCLFGLQSPGANPNVVNTTRRPIRLQVAMQSAEPRPGNPGRSACVDEGRPKTCVARLSVGLRIDHGPICVTIPRFRADPPDTRIVKDCAAVGNASALMIDATRLSRLILNGI